MNKLPALIHGILVFLYGRTVNNNKDDNNNNNNNNNINNNNKTLITPYHCDNATIHTIEPSA